MEVTLTHYTTEPLLAIEEAACNCYDSKPNNGKIAKHCIKSGHLAVAEFAQFTFHIEGVSRALTHQLVRHRLASYAQRSQRYCAENSFDYVTPPQIRRDEDAKRIYDGMMSTINTTYEKLQSLGIKNEDARMLLPNACCTAIEVSMNFRQLMHFMNERLCTRAQWEIRELANLMKKCVVNVFPEAANYLVPKCEQYGSEFAFCCEKSSCGRHTPLADIFAAAKTGEKLKDKIEKFNADIHETDCEDITFNVFYNKISKYLGE